MSEELLLFIVVGFFAQLVDGALGMAFGVISSTCLLMLGVPPATASALVHVTEVFTTAASGASHVYHRNVDWRLVARLAPAGAIGGVLGAYALSNLDADFMRPVVSIYLAGIGCFLIFKARRQVWPGEFDDRLVPLVGVAGGALDAAGGGGWGPIVTGTLLGRGHVPRTVIGSVNLTEFIVTVVISVTFVVTLGLADIRPALGLILGGVVAAPFGGYLAKRIPTRPLMVVVGIVIIATSVPRIFGFL